jgi:hypothetical protein
MTVAPETATAVPVVAAPAVSPVDRPTRVVGVVWIFLLINTLGYTAGIALIIPFPKSISQVVTMGLLAAAFGLALVINPRIRIRPNAFLVVISMLALLAVVSSLRLESGSGAVLRCFRLTLFVATLWLLSPWWRDDLRFVRHHIRALVLVLLTVLLGLVISPGSAFSGPEGRLVGAIWPIPAPQVGMYAAVLIGLCCILWLHREARGREVAVLCLPAVMLLLLSHTRTALLGLLVGMVLAGLSMLVSNGRARAVFFAAIGVGVLTAVAFGDAIQIWLARGQDAESLSNLTGRAKVWDLLLAKNFTTEQILIGEGLGDKSYAGLPIDSTWLAVFHELGWVGIILVGLVFLGLTGAALLRPPSVRRACAIFLVTYCMVASYTEVGLGDASPYLLTITVAAVLLTRQPTPDVELPVGRDRLEVT